MKPILLLIAFLSVFGANAQITLTQNEMPTIGDSFIQIIDTIPDSTLTQVAFMNGTNVTWNFSTLNFDDTTAYSFIDPAATPYSSYFPTADLSLQMGDSTFAYFVNATGASEILGVAGYMDTVEFQMIYANTDTIYLYPYTYGTAFSDYYSGQFTFYLGVDPGIGFVLDSVRITDMHQEAQEVIGWGTAITPNGSFDVLKTQVIDTNITITEAYAMGTWLPLANDTVVKVNYQWNMRNTGIPVIETNYTIYPVDSILEEIAWLFVSPSLNVDEITASSMKIYPNPAQNILRVEFDDYAPTKILVTDISGRVVLQSEQIFFGEVLLPISVLENGIYFVSAIRNSEIINTKRFIKE